MSETLGRELSRLLDSDGSVIDPPIPTRYLTDATEVRGLTGWAEAVVLPSSVENVARIMAWCYERDVPLTTRGGGTGYSGGAVPNGGVVVGLERMRRVRSFDPPVWRAEIEAGLSTAHVQRLARENGLYFPPDPGAAEQSQIGGNAATNAGGPHAFKYGVTGAWVTGVEAVIPPGRVVRLGGPIRKDVASYDLRSLLIGSEGTLGVITSVFLRFIPPPERRYPVVGFYRDAEAGASAVTSCLTCGVVPAAIEFLDEDTIDISRPTYPGVVPDGRCFMVIAEADGSECEAWAGREVIEAALSEGALRTSDPTSSRETAALWRWRDGVGLAADAALGGKVSEDIGVPVECLAEAIAGSREIGRRHQLRTCSWGHAGDGNLHSTFLFARDDAAARRRAAAAADDLFSLAVQLGGTVSGEHGLGLVKSGQIHRQLGADAADLHDGVKSMFDPAGLLNSGKKASRTRPEPESSRTRL